MKTILIIVLASIVGLVILGGGLGAFLSNVGEGTEKIKQNEKVQEITNKISSKINQEITGSTRENQSSEAQSCDSSYLDVCITPYPPDLDCGDIQYRNFKVLPPDRHGFDPDKNGLGCES